MSNGSSKSKVNVGLAFSSIAIVVGIYIFSQFVQAALVLAVEGIFKKTVTIERNTTLVCALYAFTTITMLVALFVVMRYRKVSLRDLRIKRPRWSDVGYAALGFGAYFMLAQLAYASIKLLLPAVKLDQVQDLGFGQVSGITMLLVFITIAVLPPLLEELLFRGFMFRGLRNSHVSHWTSAFIVSLIFGLAHMQLNVTIDTFILSMVMCYVLRESDSLWSTIGMHFIKNSFAFLAVFVFKVL